MEMVGVPAGPARAPVGPMAPERREELRHVVEALKGED
ncbi:MAG: hypothetical protein ACP5JG_06030 [Anaerolineae bacterium]